MRRTAILLAITFPLAALPASAETPKDALPPPVAGITYDEWAAGNARISNGTPEADVRRVLGASETDWKAAGEAFAKAMKDGGAAGPAIIRYGEVFANPNVGRFRGQPGSPEVKAKLATFEDFARVQGQLTAGTDAGMDPQKILSENGLTVYDWSQESGNWLKLVFDYSKTSPADERLRLERQATMRAWEQRWRERYAGKGAGGSAVNSVPAK